MARTRIVTASLLALLLVAGVGVLIRQTVFAPRTIVAYFTSATAIYPGDEVRVSGVKVGTIAKIEPQGAQAKMTLRVDHAVPIPADARAVIVSQNLIAARYVQLAPAYRSTGPKMPDGAVIGIDRTAVPVEWDEVKTQLMRLATELGPKGQMSTTSLGTFIDSAANALDGNGEKLHQTITELAGVGRILANGSGNLTEVINNLQTFVTALRDSKTEIVSFQNRLATVSSVLDGSRSDLDAALTNVSITVGEVQRFVAGSRSQTSEQIQRLANATQVLADHRRDLEQVLHVAPNAFANAYNIYNPDTGSPLGAFVVNNFSSPLEFVCGMIGAVENVTATETGKLCAQYLGPALRLLNFNYIPMPIDPYLMPAPTNVVYSDPALAPGGAGAPPGPPEIPPAVSAYTGLNGDVPAPPGYGQPPAVAPGPSAPDHLPAAPSPALFPGAPPASTPTVSSILLPAESGAPSP